MPCIEARLQRYAPSTGRAARAGSFEFGRLVQKHLAKPNPVIWAFKK